MSAFIKEKWERERSERRAEMKNDRLLTDKAFAKRVMEMHIAEKERENRRRLIGSRSSRETKIPKSFSRTSLVEK